jgi:hypothetical protein
LQIFQFYCPMSNLLFSRLDHAIPVTNNLA